MAGYEGATTPPQRFMSPQQRTPDYFELENASPLWDEGMPEFFEDDSPLAERSMHGEEVMHAQKSVHAQLTIDGGQSIVTENEETNVEYSDGMVMTKKSENFRTGSPPSPFRTRYTPARGPPTPHTPPFRDTSPPRPEDGEIIEGSISVETRHTPKRSR